MNHYQYDPRSLSNKYSGPKVDMTREDWMSLLNGMLFGTGAELGALNSYLSGFPTDESFGDRIGRYEKHFDQGEWLPELVGELMSAAGLGAAYPPSLMATIPRLMATGAAEEGLIGLMSQGSISDRLFQGGLGAGLGGLTMGMMGGRHLDEMWEWLKRNVFGEDANRAEFTDEEVYNLFEQYTDTSQGVDDILGNLSDDLDLNRQDTNPFSVTDDFGELKDPDDVINLDEAGDMFDALDPPNIGDDTDLPESVDDVLKYGEEDPLSNFSDQVERYRDSGLDKHGFGDSGIMFMDDNGVIRQLEELFDMSDDEAKRYAAELISDGTITPDTPGGVWNRIREKYGDLEDEVTGKCLNCNAGTSVDSTGTDLYDRFFNQIDETFSGDNLYGEVTSDMIDNADDELVNKWNDVLNDIVHDAMDKGSKHVFDNVSDENDARLKDIIKEMISGTEKNVDDVHRATYVDENDYRYTFDDDGNMYSLEDLDNLPPDELAKIRKEIYENNSQPKGSRELYTNQFGKYLKDKGVYDAAGDNTQDIIDLEDLVNDLIGRVDNRTTDDSTGDIFSKLEPGEMDDIDSLISKITGKQGTEKSVDDVVKDMFGAKGITSTPNANKAINDKFVDDIDKLLAQRSPDGESPDWLLDNVSPKMGQEFGNLIRRIMTFGQGKGDIMADMSKGDKKELDDFIERMTAEAFGESPPKSSATREYYSASISESDLHHRYKDMNSVWEIAEDLEKQAFGTKQLRNVIKKIWDNPYDEVGFKNQIDFDDFHDEVVGYINQIKARNEKMTQRSKPDIKPDKTGISKAQHKIQETFNTPDIVESYHRADEIVTMIENINKMGAFGRAPSNAKILKQYIEELQELGKNITLSPKAQQLIDDFLNEGLTD